ncbi:MAG TPA: transposase, partial [Jatrophihabitantaceae bacterium]|nr:transposase [Jatrophihabitantaceae bacterium]
MIATIKPRGVPGKTRRRLAVELIGELEAIDRKIKAVEKELVPLVIKRGPTLLDLHGIGPANAARLLADDGGIHRFANRDRSASWNGTAPWTPPPATSSDTVCPAPATGASTAR